MSNTVTTLIINWLFKKIEIYKLHCKKKYGSIGNKLIIYLFIILATINAELEILPAGDVQSKPSGTPIMLTCKAKVDNINLVSNMEWRDPFDRVVSPSK